MAEPRAVNGGAGGGSALLELLRRRLTALFPAQGPGAEGPDIALLGGDQLLVTRGLVAVPAGEGKAETYRPGVDGYQVYVAHRGPAAAPTGAQRFTAPGERVAADPRTVRLWMRAGDPAAAWALDDGRGAVLTVRVHCGPGRAAGEVNAVLREIEAVMRR
ncbi:hypothetical protein [Streptomyces sp. ODS28]|uniref:hypothetical protein n=1 Tax=Streptomyces sp. ODS28 TaxID=3136688 RepID=UPI0031E99006